MKKKFFMIIALILVAMLGIFLINRKITSPDNIKKNKEKVSIYDDTSLREEKIKDFESKKKLDPKQNCKLDNAGGYSEQIPINSKEKLYKSLDLDFAIYTETFLKELASGINIIDKDYKDELINFGVKNEQEYNKNLRGFNKYNKVSNIDILDVNVTEDEKEINIKININSKKILNLNFKHRAINNIGSE